MTIAVAGPTSHFQLERISPRSTTQPISAPTPSAIAEEAPSDPAGESSRKPSIASVPRMQAETSAPSSSRVEWRMRRWSLS